MKEFQPKYMKRRDFCFVLRNYTQQEYDFLLSISCKYLILGKELNKEGDTILQGYIYFHSPRAFSSLQNWIQRIELIESKGNSKLNFEFCSKQNIFEERGELPNNRGGKKSELKQVVKPKQLEKSFASHEKAQFWSSLNTLKPDEVCLNSHKKFWFDCPKCNHSYESILNNINANDAGCPYCYNRKLCGKEECIMCFEKSFASNEKTQFWSSKNNLSPLEVNKGTEKKYFFDCSNCGHELFISLKGITDSNRWCCYCSHQQLCEDKNCNFCFENSFASSDYAKYWNETMNSNVITRKTFKNTNKKYWFDCCVCKNSFEKRISDITSKNSWCPICKNKTERKLFEELYKRYKDIQREYKFIWCKNINLLPFDFVLLNEKIIIELDGPQHFEQVSNWGNYQDHQKRDFYKIKCANENGFSIIRILQEDVLYDKYDWLNELIKNIEKVSCENRVQNIYMCMKDEYKDFASN